jgi:hypothetical protein
MPKPNAFRRRRIPPIVAAVVQPVTKSLLLLEALLIELRYEQRVQLKRVTALQVQLDTLAEHVKANSADIRRLSQFRKKSTHRP